MGLPGLVLGMALLPAAVWGQGAAPAPGPAGQAEPLLWQDGLDRMVGLPPVAPLVLEQGQASWYSNRLHGRPTASGERYDKNGLTAAHKTLPFGTQVLVRSLQTGREVLVRIIDRGPHLKDRIIDLSHAAAEALGIRRQGVAEVQIIEP
jgi:rare lipoprotein A